MDIITGDFDKVFESIIVEQMRQSGMSDGEIIDALGRAASLAAYMEERIAAKEPILLVPSHNATRHVS